MTDPRKVIEKLLNIKFTKKHNKSGDFYEMKSLKCSLFYFPADYGYKMVKESLIIARGFAKATPQEAIYWTSLYRIENKKIELMEVMAFADISNMDITRGYKRKSDIRPTGRVTERAVCTLFLNNTPISSKNI